MQQLCGYLRRPLQVLQIVGMGSFCRAVSAQDTYPSKVLLLHLYP